MKISIIIPVYNVEQYINDCLKSILCNNNSNYEVVIINDGSPDNSIEIAKKYKEIYYDKIKIINQENQGLSITRNRGINEASGEYIWFVDSDDTLKENAIEEILKLVEKYNSIDVISMPLNHFYENGVEHADFSQNNINIITNYEYINKHYPFGASQRFILKKDFLLKNNIYFTPRILHEDGEFGLKILYYTNQICILNKSYYNYRIRSNGSIMSSWKRKNSEDLLFTFNTLLNLFKNNPLNRKIDCFNNTLFYILTASISFAKEHWSSPEFITFYNENKSLIRNKIKIIYQKCYWYKRINLLLFYISPLNYCKIKNSLNKLRTSRS